MKMTDPDQKASLPRTVAYRCTCGADVLLPAGGQATCGSCERQITLNGFDATQTVSFCAELDDEAAFHLSDDADRSGQSLGHFRLISRLGHGGMGAVYRALDESLQRFVAVKVIRSEEDDDKRSSKLVARLLDEAVAQARLNHPNVVTIYYVGREGEEPFFAMELLPGPTLGSLIQEGPIPYKQVVEYASQVCSALEQADRLGLVHGDIKPGNLILSGEKTIKLGDFGLAKIDGSGPTKGISGTLNYLAPELAKGESPTSQSDMYALGVTLFELTFGRRPYPIYGTTIKEQLDSHRAAEVVFPEKWPSSVPTRWRGVLEKLMAVDPKDRYGSYADLDHDLGEHAPVGVTNAGLLNRGLALLVDYAVLGLLMIPFLIPAQLVDQAALAGDLPEAVRTFVTRFGRLSMLAPLVPLFAIWYEWRGWRTPGRYLFQLRLVDAHGLRLEGKKRAIRGLFRYVSVLFAAITTVVVAMGFEQAALLLSPIDEIVLTIDTIPALGPMSLAVHDRLVGSQVVLDTGQESKTK